MDILAQEPALHLVILPSAGRIDSCQTLHNHLHTVRQFVDAWQTTLVLLTHHDTLVLAQRILTQPKCHQRDTQRVEVGSWCNLHLAIDNVVVHLRRSIYWCTSLCGSMQTTFFFNDTGDTEVTQHNFLVRLIAEEVVARLDILMDNVVVMTVGQCCSTLQGYTAELVEVAVEVVVCQRTTAEILHEFVVAALTLHIGLTIVGNLDDHLQIEILDNAHQTLLDGEVGVIHFQHTLALVAFYQEHLSLTRVVAQTFDTTIESTFQHEVAITELIIVTSRHLSAWSDGDVRSTSLCSLWSIHSDGGFHISRFRWLTGRIRSRLIGYIHIRSIGHIQIHILFVVFNFVSTILS